MSEGDLTNEEKDSRRKSSRGSVGLARRPYTVNPFNLGQTELMLLIAEKKSLAAAAASVGISPSAVSQQVRSIEASVGRILIQRSTRSLSFTAEGEAYLTYARAISNIGKEARSYFASQTTMQSLRFGVTEEVARFLLPVALRMFVKAHPGVEFAGECSTDASLFERFDEGHLDLIVAQRPAGRMGGEYIWNEALSWFGPTGSDRSITDPVPLILKPAPCEIRDSMLQALRDAGRVWRTTFESPSYALREAAVGAGIGVSAFAESHHSPEIVPLDPGAGVPKLGKVVFAIEARKPTRSVVAAFSSVLREVIRLTRHGVSS